MASNRQQFLDIRAALRRLRTQERILDMALERLEREIIRLRERKTQVQPDDVTKAINLWTALGQLMKNVEGAMTDFIAIVNY